MLRWLLAIIFIHYFVVDIVNSKIEHGNGKNVDLNRYLQPLDVGRNLTYDDLIDDEFLCSRNCTLHSEPRICYYKFVAEQYHAMGPACRNCGTNMKDCFSPQCITGHGIERAVLSFNRMIPGPSIQVCFGDRIVVDIQNKMHAREVTIHWHGELQKRSPWMDGVPYVTQCPIRDISTFRYDFYADTPGSHFYHSHCGLQQFDGLTGALIVRTTNRMDPLSKLYDYDLFSHTIHIKDWMHVLSDDKLPGYNKNKTLIGLEPDTYLINGMGNYYNSLTHKWTSTPFAKFKVKHNKRYRFRIIAATSTTCSFKVFFEGHSILLIAADGYPMQPVEVRSLYMSAGDIYDIVINTKQKPKSYWIRVQGYSGECTEASQLGILKYEGSEDPELWQNFSHLDQENHLLPFPQLDNVRMNCNQNPDNICLDELKSLYKASKKLLNEPDERFIFHISSYQFSRAELYDTKTYHRHYLPVSGPGVTLAGGMFADTVDHKTNIYPPFVLLSEPRNHKINDMKCPKICYKFCECLNLIKLKLNSVVEVVLIDDLSSPVLEMDHPFHFHGHNFIVVKLGSKIELGNPNFYKITNGSEYPLVRDVVLIPASGFAVIRFVADNPGFWLLHCHFTPHNLNGMAVVFQIGEPDDFLNLPQDWPKCGDYLPPVYPNNN